MTAQIVPRSEVLEDWWRCLMLVVVV